ncbi:Hsp20/alpha crystallin family protein [Acidithiobacillus sp.]|jgi:HSP20 family molecular chaperone IbpA|uniref:Hsp20/alpha crystallin family protein n=1 Tax=Acidithiobacillus sp. TaxID=1872118 RepID=UPI0025BC79A2|nr:Hsp20/alpha crystallin family protein [Acidithiobacillus sp.]MCK9188424.1 Hsp20/alpha crystallin family protein [Acidithiobacillus sp.]MCK9358845.1 Hsp20/alpha crystallin family protein [Acidithiobacillus sp.]
MRELEDIMWMQAIDMLERAERLQRRFFQPARSDRQPLWQPPTDVFETSEGLQIVVALPGVSPEAVRVIFSGNVLMVSGLRRLSADLQTGHIHRLEIPYGAFDRRLRVPDGLTLQGWEMRDGCLHLSFRQQGV